MYSYNYQAGTHLAAQNYNNCIRTEQGYCSISYSAVGTNDFELSGTDAARVSDQGDSCSQDYVYISGGAADTTPTTTTQDRWCGGILNSADANAAQGTIVTKVTPFQIGVVTDANEETYYNIEGVKDKLSTG